MSFLYAILSSFICGTCLLVIGTANPIHAILLLIRVFFIGTILLFCLQMEYYARLFLIVYVGAIVVLFLFIIRMLELKMVNVSTRLGDLFAFRHLIRLCLRLQVFFSLSAQFFDLNGFLFKNEPTIGLKLDISIVTLFSYVVVLAIILFALRAMRQNPFVENKFSLIGGTLAYNLVSLAIITSIILIRLFSVVSRETSQNPVINPYFVEANQYINWSQLIYRPDQLRSLGAILYTEYMVSVILASLLLFVSMVGALAVTLFFPKNHFSVEEINSIKRQDPNNQAIRNPKFRGVTK